jgi:6-phosphogluconate dehydrogenase
MATPEIGLIGCGVMGSNLGRNMARRGFRVTIYDSDPAKVSNCQQACSPDEPIQAAESMNALIGGLSKPRMIMMMVPAGQPVDDCIDELLPHLDAGDILIDGGNSHYADTTRRVQRVESAGQLFIGTGVSGGAEGALLGPAIMPGGSTAAWKHIAPVLQAIAARDTNDEPCCDWVGPQGAGHFVKMIHNGIEYGDMQIICEGYQLLRYGLGMPLDEVQAVFARWNQGVLSSYLMEITADILTHRDADGNATLDNILDAAGQKGTGTWTAIAALKTGQPVTLIGEAVFARCLSALKDERVHASEILTASPARFDGDQAALVNDLEQALYAAKIISYAQGFQLMRAVALEAQWPLNYGRIAKLWRAGCIIRSAFLEPISAAFQRDPALENLVLDSFFKDALLVAESAWRRVVVTGVQLGIPLPALGAALAYFDGYRSATLPANLLQAQRDYFGSHTYERVDRPRGEFHHTDWKANVSG